MLRRATLSLALAFAFILTSTPGNATSNAAVSRVEVKRVGPIAMTVVDMDRAVDFYGRVLTFEKISDIELAGDDIEHLYGVFGARVRVVRLQLGDEQIELTEFLAPRGRPIPVDSRSNDRWFQHIAVVVSDMDRAYQILRQNKVEFASSGPQTLPNWNPNASGIRAFYFKDPDQHPVEVIYFPEGKGLPKWHRNTERVFLGIDHTAIVVSDTDASLRFYRDTLGFKVSGESDNYGSEQEHLNLIHGAHLRITSLRAPGGPGIEFLQYLSPTDGRNAPADLHANDIVHRATLIEIEDVSTIVSVLRETKVGFISPDVVSFPQADLGYRAAFLVRDPDGHAIEIVSPR